ncbi:MAG: hypothetical protein K8I30_02100 [Anaerolineae bacterium]|nr:hypothetical protein [Anaerolineae bacterium]
MALGTVLHLFAVPAAVGLGGLLPNAGQLAYEARVERNIDIFLIDITHRISVNLTRHPAIDSRPVWSPDGRFLAFETTRDRTPQIYIMAATGENPRPVIADYNQSQYNPVWTADGQALVFQAYYGVGAPTFRVNLKTLHVEKIDPLPPAPRTANPEINAVVLALKDGRWGIALYTENWSERQQITDNNVRFRDAPRWSPDGRRMAFVSSGMAQNTEIYVLNVDGSDFRRLTADGMFKNNLAWRPIE